MRISGAQVAPADLLNGTGCGDPGEDEFESPVGDVAPLAASVDGVIKVGDAGSVLESCGRFLENKGLNGQRNIQ
jgi:hypothetical protein